MTYNIVKIQHKVAFENRESMTKEKWSAVRKLALAEMTEGLAPIVIAIGFALAYYGPNSMILGNVKNEYWGYKQLVSMMHKAY